MTFKEFKQRTMIELRDCEDIDEPMIPWLKKFNKLSDICTVFCCDGVVKEKERKEWQKMLDVETQILKDAGYDVIELIAPHNMHPYISFVSTIYQFPVLWNIEGLRYCSTDTDAADEEFTLGIRDSIFAKDCYDYFFHFPTGKNFDEKMKKVYNKTKSLCESFGDFK